jgi:hypothetical protein
MPPSLFTVGDLVEVDQMKTGYLIEIDRITIPQNILFKIRSLTEMLRMKLKSTDVDQSR